MINKIKIKKAYVFAFAFVVLIAMLAVSGTRSSKTDAKYYTELDSDATTARVAKWDIKGVTKRDGKSINLAAGFSKKLNEGDTGSWYFQISNYSEVFAAISKRSKIRFRLDNDSYADTSVNEIKWDFLEDLSKNPIENPISFEINIYNSTVEDLLTYRLKSDPSVVISYDAYSQLTNKADYDEVIDTSVANCQLFKTSSSLTFNKAFEKDENGKTVYFYYAELSFENISDSQLDEILKLGLGNTKTDVTIQVKWNIGRNAGGNSINDNNYKVYELTDNLLNATYKSYDLIKNNSTYTSYDLVMNANQFKYYSVSNSQSSAVTNGAGYSISLNRNYLNATTYTSLLNYYNNFTSEPSFTLTKRDFQYYATSSDYTSRTSKTVTINALSQKKYSELTSEDIAKLESCSVYETHYRNYSSYSIDDLNNYANYMNYKNYKAFLETTKFTTNDTTRAFDVSNYKIISRINTTSNYYIVTSANSLTAKGYLDSFTDNEPTFTIGTREILFSDLTTTDIATITGDTYNNYVYNQYVKFLNDCKYDSNNNSLGSTSKAKIKEYYEIGTTTYCIVTFDNDAKTYLDSLTNNEPSFTFNATTVYYSDLTPTYKNLLNSYNDTTTRAGLNNLIDKYRYLEHYNYIAKAMTVEDTFVIDGKTYYIISTSLNLYDYNVYFHSNPTGEPLFKFTNALGKEITVRYKLLTNEQKETIKGYSISSNPTYNELTKMLEKLTLEQYEQFVLDNLIASTNSSYLEYGLKCKIEFELYVEQVD